MYQWILLIEKKICIALGEGLTDGLNKIKAIKAEAKYSVNITKFRKKIRLSLHSSAVIECAATKKCCYKKPNFV